MHVRAHIPTKAHGMVECRLNNHPWLSTCSLLQLNEHWSSGPVTSEYSTVTNTLTCSLQQLHKCQLYTCCQQPHGRQWEERQQVCASCSHCGIIWRLIEEQEPEINIPKTRCVRSPECHLFLEALSYCHQACKS